MESRQRWVRHHRSEQGVVFTPKGHTENTKLMKKIPLNSNDGLSYTWMTAVLQLWAAFNSRDKVGVSVCWCWRLCREVPSADSSRIQSPRAQSWPPAAERSQTPPWNRSWCTGILFSQRYRPQQQQHHLQSSPRSTPATSVGRLPSAGLWKPSSIHTLPSCPYAIATSSLLPNQALCRFYQHPLNKLPTMDIARFPFTASSTSLQPKSTLCSPNALDCKNKGRMGSLHDNLRFHMLGASWYLYAAKTHGASQEPHCETKAEPWAATTCAKTLATP